MGGEGDVAMPSHIGSHPLATLKALPGPWPTRLGDSIQIPMQIHDPHSYLDPPPGNHQGVASDNYLAWNDEPCPHAGSGSVRLGGPPSQHHYICKPAEASLGQAMVFLDQKTQLRYPR